jgi:membrane associated rhomboid family serine protease
MIPLRGSLRGQFSPVVTFLLVAANIVIFLGELTLPPGALQDVFSTWGLVPAHEMAAGSIVFAVTSALTSMFLHAGWAHVLFNMLYLWVFGSGLESRIGSARFGALYFAAGIVASQAQVWLSPFSEQSIVGASGAIAGVLGAYFVVDPRATIRVLLPIWIIPFFFNVPAVVFLGLWFLQNALSGTVSLAAAASGGVAWWAHVGGFIAGALLVRSLGLPPPPRRRNPHDDPYGPADGPGERYDARSLRRAGSRAASSFD